MMMKSLRSAAAAAAALTTSICLSCCERSMTELSLENDLALAIAAEVTRQTVGYLTGNAMMPALIQGISGDGATPEPQDQADAARQLAQATTDGVLRSLSARRQPDGSVALSFICFASQRRGTCATRFADHVKDASLMRIQRFGEAVAACRSGIAVGATPVEIVDAREKLDACVVRAGFGDEVAAILRVLDRG